jgi:endonuclease/exonuclease/phosphatase (EEP) superfamily protein YafD
MNAQMKYFGSARVPSIVGTVKTAGGSFLLLSTHTLPPRALDYFFYRNDQLAAIGSFLAQANGTVILAGDLNAPPWSPFFQKLCSEARLIDSERGFGVQPTWPTNTSLLWIPIDHLLYRGKITVLRRNVYHYVGSDHFPVCVDLNIAD